MRNPNVILFDGEEIIQVDQTYFFQDPSIKNLNPSQFVELYKSTAVFSNLISNLNHLIQSGSIKEVNSDYSRPEFAKAVRQGLYILEGAVLDLFGDLTGKHIINSTNQIIGDEVAP